MTDEDCEECSGKGKILYGWPGAKPGEGNIGDCALCEGSGKQEDADRILQEAMDAIENGDWD